MFSFGFKEPSHFQALFQKLPPPFAITTSQIRSCYRSFYEKLLESYNNMDLLRINDLLESTQKVSAIISFPYPSSDEDPSKDNLLSDFASLLFKIITIFPVKHYKVQLLAASFLNSFLDSNRNIPRLTLEWKPFYKVMNYYLNEFESNFLSGFLFTQRNFTSNLKPNTIIIRSKPLLTNKLKELQPKLSKYFQSETETQNNGLIVKTDTTEQLVKKFISNISTNICSSGASLRDFINYAPPIKGEYKKFLDYFLYLIKDPKPFKNNSILIALNKIVMVNIEDDFSCLFPFLFHLTSDQVLSNLSCAFFTLPDLLISLFISPPTRKSVLELLESFFISFKSNCHPTVERQGVADLFIEQVVTTLRIALKKLRSKKENKICYNMDEKLGPSQDDIHRLLSMTSEINIMNIRNCFNHSIILIETSLDPLLIDRYFDIAFQCIDLMDAFDVARSGWTILTALMMHIDKNEKIKHNFENIFQIATNNLYRAELILQISSFLSVSLLKVPFDKKKTLKGLENTNFSKLAYSYLSNVIAMLRSAPSAKEEAADSNYGLTSYIALCINELFRNCESEVFDEVLSIVESLAYDEDIFHCVTQVELIIANFCFYANREQAMKVIKIFQSKFESSDSNLNNFRYFSTVLSTIIASTLLTKESVKQSVDLILPYTENANEKIRKAAWVSVSYALTIFNRIINAKIELKPEKMKEYPFESARLEDFNIKFDAILENSDISFEVFDPIFDKLLEMKDQYELNSYFNELYEPLMYVVKDIYLFTEGSRDMINEVYNNSISFVPELIKKLVPIKDKLFRCLIRIVRDFPENENLINKVIFIIRNLFQIFSDSSISLISSFFIQTDDSKKYYNNGLLYNSLISKYEERKTFYIIPITEDIKTLFEMIIDLTVSNSKDIREICSGFISFLMQFYSHLFIPHLEKIVERKETIPMKNFVSFLNSQLNFDFLFRNDKLFCQVIHYLLKNFESNEKETEFLNNIKNFLSQLTKNSPFESISEDSPEYLNLLDEIEKDFLNKSQPSRSFVSALINAIIICLKHVKSISDNVLCFIIHQIIHYDQDISSNAFICLCVVLKRQEKYTKERIEVKNFPTITAIPNMLDKITVQLPPNGCYFPSNIKSNDEVIDNNDDQLTNTLSGEYSIDINPATSIEVNLDNTEVDEEIIKIFETFKTVKIEVNMTEEEKNLFDSEFFFSHGNGFFLFKDHYHHKKYEFVDNKTLIKHIPDIFASAINAINERNLRSSVSYSTIWSHYALTVGPFCIRKLSKISRKYLSEYFALRPEVTSKVLYDMVLGFLKNIYYWKIEDRIQFYLQVALPVICVISSSPFINKNIRSLFILPADNTNVFCLAPVFKVMLELFDKGPGSDHFNSCFLNNIVHVIMSRQIFFFSAIDQLKAKYITPFIENMNEYKMNEIADISFLFFRLFDCCSFIPKTSPLYSNEIESKTVELLSIFESVIQKENVDDQLIYFLINTFRFFSVSSFQTRLMVAPVFIKNIHIIFQLLKKSRISTEESFISSFRNFIENDIFFTNSKMQFDFFSPFIREIIISPLPLQQMLLDNINKMFEVNIFSIKREDYGKFEHLLLHYGKHENSKNFGNELRMKIAKILGIFELRKCSLKKSEIDFEKVASDENLKDELILISSSIILNTYLFDRVDERVTDALEIMETLCIKSGKNLKNKIFFKSVLEVFVHRHSGHVINEVEDILIQYKYMMTPSYIC